MPAEHAVALVGLVFLVVNGLWLVVSVRRGRALCERLAQRWPQEYEELGSPRPGYFQSLRRSAYFQLVMQRRYEALGDPVLVEEFEAVRRAEMGQLVFLLAGFGALGIALLLLRFWS